MDAMPNAASQAVLDNLLSRCRTVRTPCGDGDLVWRVWDEADAHKPPVVLLHGGYGAWSHWVRTIPGLEPDYQAVAPDLPGCGDSADPPEPYDLESLAAILSQGLDAALPDGATFDLVSFSFGGLLSGEIARAQGSRLRSLTIVGTPLLGLKRTGRANELVNVPADLPPHQAAPLYRGNLQKLMVHDPAAVDDLAMTLHMANMSKARLRSRRIARTVRLADSLQGLSCPLNFIFGDSDVTADPDVESMRAYAAETYPDAPFHIIPEAGHWVQYEAADQFNAILSQVLAA